MSAFVLNCLLRSPLGFIASLRKGVNIGKHYLATVIFKLVSAAVLFIVASQVTPLSAIGWMRGSA